MSSNQESSQLISLQEDGLYLLNLNETTSSKLDLPFTLPDQTEPVCILHCRGMLCLTLEGNNDLAIWNPSSKEFIKRILTVKPVQTTNLLGFGYDRVSNDYKIVTFVNDKTYIYAFKESSWRESIPNPFLDCKFENRTGTVVDHCMYWIADRSHSLKENTILCFDFVNEEYQELFYPMCRSESKFGSWLSVLREELCVIDHYPSLDHDICVWYPQRRGKKIEQWKVETWINMEKTLKGFQRSFDVGFARITQCYPRRRKSFDVGFACIARNDEIFIVLKGRGNGEDKVMVYNKRQEKFIEISFGSSLKGLRCMSDYVYQ